MPEQQPGPAYYGYGYYPAPARPATGSGLRTYLDVLRRRAWIILAATVIIFTIGVIKVFRAPRIYEAVAKVLVERRSSRVVFDGVIQDYAGWDPDYYTTQAALIRSRVVMEMALENPPIQELFKTAAELPENPQGSFLGELKRTVKAALGMTPAAPLEPWQRLRNQISTSLVKETHFVMVRAAGGNPERAALLANAAATAFEQYHVQKQVEALGDAFAFLQREKAKEERLLREAEEELQQFREQAKGISLSVSSEHRPAQASLVELNNRLTSVQLRRGELVAKLEVMREIEKTTRTSPRSLSDRFAAVPAIRMDASLESVHRSLGEAQKEAATLAGTYGPEHPRLRTALGNVELLKEQFLATVSQVIESDMNQLKILGAEEREFERLYEEEKQKSLEVAKEAFTFTHLRNAVERHRRLFDAIVQRMLEVDISSGFSKTNVQVVEKASVPRHPINPRGLQKIFLSLGLGLVVGAGLAFFFENLDDTVKTPEDLRDRLDVPLLGFVPNVPVEKKPEGTSETSYKGTVTLFEPISSVSEAYRHVCASLLYSSPQNGPRMVAVTSCQPREGKTTTSANLALILAQRGKKVLLVDGDLHRPVIHRIFEINPKRGLTNVLVGEAILAEAVHEVHHNGAAVPNLDVLPSGPSSPNPAELIGSVKMQSLLEDAKEVYDWIFVDTPPVFFVSDASVLGALCDGVVLVVKAGKSRRSMLLRAKEQLENVNAKIIGSLLNGVMVSRFGRYHSYYAYHGYSRYAKDYHRTYYGDRDTETAK